MAYIQHNNPFKITSCGRRRTFMQSGSPGKDRTEGNPFGIDKTDAEKNADAASAAVAYKWKREREYPSIEDQIDKIYHDGIDEWKVVIKAVKDKYPKP